MSQLPRVSGLLLHYEHHRPYSLKPACAIFSEFPRVTNLCNSLVGFFLKFIYIIFWYLGSFWIWCLLGSFLLLLVCTNVCYFFPEDIDSHEAVVFFIIGIWLMFEAECFLIAVATITPRIHPDRVFTIWCILALKTTMNTVMRRTRTAVDKLKFPLQI